MSSPSATHTNASPLRRTASAFLRTLTYPHTPDDYLQALRPSWTLDRVVARVVDVRHETGDITSLYLEPSRNFRPHRAGQHVLLTVTLAGVDHTRCFSLSDAYRPGQPLRLTIKAHEGGRVSNWAKNAARAGVRVGLSQAQGEFVLPETLPEQLLFVSGGSGLTPLLAMAHALVGAGYRGSLHWIHTDRTEVALLDEMRECCAALGAQLHVHLTAPTATDATDAHNPRLTATDVASCVPDFAERELFMCGPFGLMDALTALYDRADRADHVHHEAFGPRSPFVTKLPTADGALRLVLAKSRRTLRAAPGASLLSIAEDGGLNPPHGCRRGICHTCKCTKRHGTVRNELTGAVSDAPDEEIRLCIHTPITDVALDL